MFDVAKTAEALAEPARLAIEKLAAGAGTLYEPTHIRRLAKAEADQKIIEAMSDADLNQLDDLAKNRLAYRQRRQEINLTRIADRAATLLLESPSQGAQPPVDEWVDEFTDQSRDASTDELRELWSKIYASETRKPGSVPKRFMKSVRDIDASLARSLARILGCCAVNNHGHRYLIAFDGWIDKTGIDHHEHLDLEDFGILKSPNVNSRMKTSDYQIHDRIVKLIAPEGKPRTLCTIYRFTALGNTIASIADVATNAVYIDNLCNYFSKTGWRVAVMDPR